MSHYAIYGAAAVGVALAGMAGIQWGLAASSHQNLRKDFTFAPLNEPALADRLKGKRVLIVGGTKGIGANLALALAKRGANVVFSGRSDTNNVLEGLKKANPQGNHAFIKADANTVKNTVDLAQAFMAKYDRLDILILCVGIISTKTRTETPDGLEEDFAVSYFSRYIILQQMKEYLKKQAQYGEAPRVYIYGYHGHGINLKTHDDVQWKKTYEQWSAHMNTIVFNEALVNSFAKEAPEVAVFGIAPGLIQTDIRRNAFGFGFFGNAIESFIGLFGRDMNAHVEAIIQDIASPELGIKQSASFFNTYGELVHSTINKDDQTFATQYSAQLYDEFLKKVN